MCCSVANIVLTDQERTEKFAEIMVFVNGSFNRRFLVLFVIVLLALQGKSFSVHARKVKNVITVVAIEKDQSATNQGETNFSTLHKETHRNAAQSVQRSRKPGGRKNNSKKVTSKVENQKWKENIMAFSADYRSPKSHPPKNNR